MNWANLRGWNKRVYTEFGFCVCHRDQRNWSNSQERHNCQKEQKKKIPSKTTPFSHFRQKQKKSSQLFRSLRSRPPTRTRFTGLGKYTTNGQLNVLQCSFRTTRLKKKMFLRFICWLKFLIEHSFAGLWLRIINSIPYQSTSPARFVKMAKSGKVTAVLSQMNNSDGRNKKDNLF